MHGWATAAWLAGVAGAPAGDWMGRRWRRYGDPSIWPLLLGGLAMLAIAALRISQDPTGPRRLIEVVALVVGAVALTVGVAGLVIQRHWNRRRAGERTDRRSSP
jgi:peptidoglycan/LPS O-acetylase OafA/YrhL